MLKFAYNNKRISVNSTNFLKLTINTIYMFHIKKTLTFPSNLK